MLPTYLILLLFMGIFHVLYKGDLSFILLVFFIVLPIILTAILALQTKLLRLSVLKDASLTERGKPAIIKIMLENPTVFPITACKVTMRYECFFAPDKCRPEKYSVTVPINRRTKECITVKLVPEHCGTVFVQLKSVSVSDFIGLIWLPKKVRFRDKLVVMPCAYSVDASQESSFVSDSESSVFSAVRSGDDPSEIFQLREYRDGDRLNRIHWKLSSRGESFIVKEISDPINSKILILCDFSECKGSSDADSVFDISATLSAFLADKGAVHTIAALFADNSFFLREIKDSDGFLNTFAELCANSDKLNFSESIFSAFDKAVISSEENILAGRGFSRIIAVRLKADKAFVSGLAQFGGEAGLTVFCTSADDNIEENDGIYAEIICSEAEYLNEKNINI